MAHIGGRRRRCLGHGTGRGRRPRRAWVTLWGRDAAAVERDGRACARTPAYLPGIALPDDDPADRRASTQVADAAMVLLAVPAQQLRAVVPRLPGLRAPLVIAAKGLERATGLRLSEVVRAERPDAVVAALSGPSFALEVARGLPTAVTIAATTSSVARSVAETPGQPRVPALPVRRPAGRRARRCAEERGRDRRRRHHGQGPGRERPRRPDHPRPRRADPSRAGAGRAARDADGPRRAWATCC